MRTEQKKNANPNTHFRRTTHHWRSAHTETQTQAGYLQTQTDQLDSAVPYSQTDHPDSAALHAPAANVSDSASCESVQHTPGHTARHNYMQRSTALYLSALLLLTACVISLLAGKYPLSLEKILAGDAMQLQVLLTLRIPRTLMAVLGGFALGAAGFVFQTVFRNPLAAPDMIGVSSGASAGAAFAILVLPASAAAVTLSAFAGGLLAVGIALGLASAAGGYGGGLGLYRYSRKTASSSDDEMHSHQYSDKSNTSSHRWTYSRRYTGGAASAGSGSIVLAGIVVHSLAQTVLMILKLTADPERQLASIEYWIMGSLNAITLSRIPFYCTVCAAGLAGLFLLHRQIILLSVDEAEARMLGVPVGRMRLLILLLATLVVASVISVTGVISFIGLLAPHIARLLMRDNRLHTLTLSGLLGGVLLTAADILTRTVTASELPVSIFTSLLGAPFLLYLIMSGNGGKNNAE